MSHTQTHNLVGKCGQNVGRMWAQRRSADVLPGQDYGDGGWSVSSVWVYLQRPTHGLAMPLRRSALRSAARTALPDPRPRPGVDARRPATSSTELALSSLVSCARADVICVTFKYEL
jgi:hypothetical protein